MRPNDLNDDRHDHQDEVIQEVRANREDYAARFGYDVRAILRRARERAREAGAKKREPRRVVVPGAS